ncbi:MAG: immunoglobulin domain-containing protein, partial [Chitinivibrionales bacterium]
MRDIRATVHLISISAIVICFLLVFEGFGDNLTVDADGGGADYTSLNDVLDALNGGVTTDTVLFIGSDQDTYEMSEYLGNYDPDTLVFISTQTGPDMYPVIQRPSENYQNLFDNTSVVFERLIFEGSQEFDIYSSVDQVFRKCVFRDFTNSNGAILLQSEGGGVTIENSLFFNNANCIRLNIWQGYEFHVVNSTFDDNDTVFSVEKIEYDTQYSQLQNNIFSNNTVIVPSAYDELLLRISYSLTDESLSGYGTDCVSGDPDYKTETGRSLPSDWDIDVDSKAIGIGVSDALTPDDDIAGRLREVIDAGCWKYIEPPSITTAAYSDSVAIEDSVTIIAEAVGAEPFTWQWFKDSVELTDETGDTLKISSVAPSDSGVYSAAAHNAGGHDTADICTLSVGEAVTIESHPQSVTVVENEDHTFSVTATGAGTLHYQWQKDSVDIDGATDSSVTVTGITGSDTGAYRCIITSNYGADSSDNAVLSIGDPGRIETQPEDVYLNPGDTAVFSVTATGDTPLSYQWQEDQSGWTDISGETDTVFKVPDVVLGDDALYRCFVTNDLGSDTSVTAELSVGEPPTISSHPEDNVYAPESSDVVFTVSHDTAYGEYHYEWEMDSGSGWELLSGSDTDSLLLTQVSASDEGDYRVRIINPYGEALSDPALLGICYPPSIGEQPGNQGVVLGDSAHFSVSAEGTNLKYQWQDNTADSDWSDIESATDSVYSLMPVSEDDGTYYRVVLSGECGEEVSDSAVLSVCTPPNGITGPDITSHSADEYIIEGDDVTIEVGAEGTDPSYQWQNSTGGSTWSDIQGATEPSYSFNPTSDHDEKHYRAGITACSVTEYSDGVVVTVNDTPRILTHPDDVTVDEDQTAEFSIE